MMSTFCKLFCVFCIVFLIASPVRAANSLFTVDSVEADVSAENALAAREKAFQQAQVEAFKTLAERMVSEYELQNLKVPEGLALSSLIQDFEVRNEKLSATRYSATYKFRFKDDDVRAYFSQEGTAYTDVARKPVLILPFMEKPEGGLTLWSPTNRWMMAWNNAPRGDGLVPLILPIGDLMDVNDIGDDEALTYNARRLASMVRRYNASEAVIALARRSESNGGLEVQIYRTDRERPEYVHQIVQPALASGDALAPYMVAVSKVREALRNDWKARTVFDTAQGGGEYGYSALKVRVQFGSLEEWSRVRRALERVDAVEKMELDALSSREAYLLLSFRGGFERLSLALQQSDMFLQGGQAGIAGRESIYDLSYQRYGSFSRGSSYVPGSPGGRGEYDSYSAQF